MLAVQWLKSKICSSPAKEAFSEMQEDFTRIYTLATYIAVLVKTI
jgi:hypothetical protein